MGRGGPSICLVAVLVVSGCTSVTAPSAEGPSDAAGSPEPSVAPESSAPSALASAIVSLSPSVVPEASAEPDPSATAEPSVVAEASPPADLRRTFTKTHDDIRVTVTLQRNPLPAGELSWVRTKIENLGRTTVTWFHDGCATPVYVGGPMAQDWRYGVTQTGQAKRFKDLLLGVHLAGDPVRRPSIDFVRKDSLSRGQTGCGDIGISEAIRPGRSVGETRWWSGHEQATKGLPASGRVELQGWAAYLWRGAEPTDVPSRKITFPIEAWVSGGAPADRPSPPEIIDRALTDPSFVAYIEPQDLASGREEILWYDASHDVWEIGVMPWYETDPPRIHGLVLDATTGAIIGPLDRAWDKDHDGFPY